MLCDYINARRGKCSICQALLCKGHVVAYELPFYYIYKHFMGELRKYLTKRQLSPNYDLQNRCTLKVVSGSSLRYTMETSAKGEILDEIKVVSQDSKQNVKFTWETLRTYLISSKDAEDRRVGNEFFTNKIIITPQRLREDLNQRHYETKLLSKIVMAREKAQLSDVLALAKTGELDPDKQTTFQMITTKTGIIRGALYSKFPSNNGRFVVTPASCSFGTVILPHKFKELVTEDIYSPGMQVRQVRVDGEYINYNPTMVLAAGDFVMRPLRDGDPVIVNRQPTLHWRSMMVHRVKFGDGAAIGLHPCVTSAYNADFDGDEINIHAYPSIRASMEGLMLMNSMNAFASSKRVYIGMLFHELTVLYKYSSEVDFFPKDFYYNFNGVVIANGRVMKGQLCKKTIGISNSSAMYQMMFYGHKVICKFIDDALVFCKRKIDEHALTYTDEFLTEMISSGGRGSESNRKMLYEKIGDIFNSTNEQIKLSPENCKFTTQTLDTIDSCYKNGLTPLEVVAMSIPIRESLIVAKTKISEAGALMNKSAIVLSPLTSDADYNLVYAGKVVSENVTFQYKYYNQEFDGYVDVRQLIYALVVTPRLEGHMSDDIEADFRKANVSLPSPIFRKPYVYPEITNTTTLRESFHYTEKKSVIVATLPYNVMH